MRPHSTRARMGLIAVLTAGLAGGLVAATPAAGAAPAVPAAPAAPSGKTVKAQIVAFNDFHGHLESAGKSISARTGSSKGSGYVAAGGAGYLSAAVKALKKQNRNTVVVSAGDMIGASPMISGYYKDEPTIEAMNEIVDVASVGNHEFDEGTAELRRLARKMDFDLMAANVVYKATGQPMFRPTVTKTVGGAKIGFIGITTIDTPHLIIPELSKDVDFLDPVQTIRRYEPELRSAGADAVVVIAHEGSAQNNGITGKAAPINECRDVRGPAMDIARSVSNQVDAVITGHTHRAYNCRVDGTPVTQAATYGRLVTKIDLTIDTGAHEVTRSSAKNIIVRHTRKQDPAVKKIVAKYAKRLAPKANKVVGRMAKGAGRTGTRSGESYLGDLIADAHLAATRKNGAQLAIVPRGVLRGDLERGRVTAQEVWTAQPFGVRLVTKTFTGRQLDTALEQQFCNDASTTNDRLQPLNVSRSFRYRYDPDKACGNRIRMADTKLNGKAITPDGKYRVTIDAFMGAGGGGMEGFRAGTDRKLGPTDQAALTQYLQKNSPITPQRRIRVMPTS